MSNRRSQFGNIAILTLLLAQVLDGSLTYLGVSAFGRTIEANPLLNWLMATVGNGAALTGAKLLAGLCAVVLHLQAAHTVVAALAVVYVSAAVVPWMSLLFF